MTGARSSARSVKALSKTAGSRLAAIARKTCVHGKYAGVPPASQHRPHPTVAPWRSAASPSSLASRVLPMPASPAIRATKPRPCEAALRASARSSSSPRRPMNGISRRGTESVYRGVRRFARDVGRYAHLMRKFVWSYRSRLAAERCSVRQDVDREQEVPHPLESAFVATPGGVFMARFAPPRVEESLRNTSRRRRRGRSPRPHRHSAGDAPVGESVIRVRAILVNCPFSRNVMQRPNSSSQAY
jgi:hypothetical protein